MSRGWSGPAHAATMPSSNSTAQMSPVLLSRQNSYVLIALRSWRWSRAASSGTSGGPLIAPAGNYGPPSRRLLDDPERRGDVEANQPADGEERCEPHGEDTGRPGDGERGRRKRHDGPEPGGG